MCVDYRLELILIYLNTVNEEYTYKEMSEFIGVCYDIIDNMLIYMEEKGLIDKDKYCIIKVSDKGRKLLDEKGLLDIDIYSLYNEYQINDNIKSKNIGIDDIYVPKNFKIYFNGYAKSE